MLHVSCNPNADLVQAASSSGVQLRVHGTPGAAIEAAGPGDAVALLAPGYPARPFDLSAGEWAALLDSEVRAYVEYPRDVPGLDLGEPTRTRWERVVVTSDLLGDLEPGRILVAHGCTYLPAPAEEPHLVAARVAGYDEAIYGVPEGAAPLLFDHPDGPLLVATTGLSHFIRGRYAPTAAWASIWRSLLKWLLPGREVAPLSWEPAVRPTHGAGDTLSPGAESRALERGAEWYDRSRLLIHRTWLPHLAPRFSRGIESGPPAPSYLATGTGEHGLLEGYSAEIDATGEQSQRYVIRNDCVGESAMALAFHAHLRGDPQSALRAGSLIDYALFDSLIHQGVRADPHHPAYGLLSWGVTSWSWERAFYGDDNARSLLGAIASTALLHEPRWGESICRALLANLRTTGTRGFRGGRIDIPDLEAHGWRHFHDRDLVNPAPHYEAYLWACYLWAYRATGHGSFLTKARAAIETTMGAYPDGWHWTNGIAQERARMLLPLAWLVRLEDSPRHRMWLLTVARDLLANQVPCGAIREELGDPGKGRFPGVPSNEAYGTSETPLIQSNGDPACDLLYTTNFAFLGLHEAAAATGDRALKAAEDRLAEFLTRIQIRSEAHPELDGGWFRAFDYDKWDYWASSADVGWGAWCIESGWTQGWITSVLGLRQLGTSLWELTGSLDLSQHMPDCLLSMAINAGGPYEPRPRPCDHLAQGCRYRVTEPPDARYPDEDGSGLTDGRAWPPNVHEQWAGWYGAPMRVEVDLGGTRPVTWVGGVFLVNTDIGILPPSRLRVWAGAEPGAEAMAAEVRPPGVEPGDREVRAVEIGCHLPGEARYVTLAADPAPVIPAWHRAGGLAAWLMCGELLIR
jgi:hypothetical protein